jgi:predicted aspartyl protease
MRLTLRDNLPFVSLRAVYHGKELEIADVLVDTGSGGTVLAADVVASLGIMAEPGDMLHAVRGVGGYEYVFDRQLDHLQLGTQRLANFTVEISGLDYGFPINGILGMDFLTRTGAILNLQALSLELA